MFGEPGNLVSGEKSPHQNGRPSTDSGWPNYETEALTVISANDNWSFKASDDDEDDDDAKFYITVGPATRTTGTPT